MEIRISAQDGVQIPDDCIVNVSVGDVQKQARYDPRKLYRFRDAKRTAKIDLYQQIGSCDVAWNCDEPASVSCVAKGSSGSGIPLSVNLTPVIPKEKATESADKADASMKARQYLKEHAVEDLLTKAMRELLKAMPQDSHAFLAEYITNRGVVPSPARPTAVAVPQATTAACGSTSVAAAQETTGATTAVSVMPETTTTAPRPRKDLGQIRAQACDVLLKASNNGLLNEVLTEMMEDRPKGGSAKKDLVALRVQAADVLMKASANGSLQSVLSEIRQEQVPASTQTRSDKKDLVGLRVHAADVLMQASNNGTLQSALKEIRQEQVLAQTKVHAAKEAKPEPCDEIYDGDQLKGATKIQANFRGQQTRKSLHATEQRSLIIVDTPFADKISIGMPFNNLPMLFI
jgi:hypothetical protein